MIKIHVKKKDNQINGISIKGHANYADYGQDIVCAAVSSIVITSINAIINIDKNAIEYNDTMFIKNIKKDDITNKLLTNMLNMLNELKKDYPKNIQIREEEI